MLKIPARGEFPLGPTGATVWLPGSCRSPGPERPQGVERNIVLIRSSKANPLAPSPLWGPNPIWDSQTSINNQMMDEKGRVWAAARIHPPNNPAFCKKGSDHPSAKIFPLNAWSQQLSMYDPASGKFTLIST